MHFDSNMPVGLVAVMRPDWIGTLGSMGIDLVLEHDRTLADALAMRDIDPRAVVADLNDDDRDGAPGLDWSAVRPVVRERVEWSPSALLFASA